MTRWKQAAVLTMAGGAMVVGGALLPWATISSGFGTVSLIGIEGDGVFAVGLGALVALGGFGAYNGSATARTAAALLAILALGFVVFEFSSLSEGVGEITDVRASLGIGLWVCGLGALLATGATLAAGTAPQKAENPPAPEGTSG